MTGFQPDQQTLEMLRSEYEHVWIGPKLTAIANRIRNIGGSENDYRTWVLASHLWLSYEGNTADGAAKRNKNLEGAWQKSGNSTDFDLEEALTDLHRRIAAGFWAGKAGSRNQAVALAFVCFCIENNCFTRTMSCYELSKYTPGIAPNTVNKALRALVDLGLLSKVDRTDKRESNRSTIRYQINLGWNPERSVSAPDSVGKSVSETMSTGKDSLSPLRTNEGEDLWTSRGLGLTAGRVYAVLADEPATIAEISERAGVSKSQARGAATKLFDHCLAGVTPGRPARYFKLETPLSAVADMLGCSGYAEYVVEKTEFRQMINRQCYPGTYVRLDRDSPTE